MVNLESQSQAQVLSPCLCFLASEDILLIALLTLLSPDLPGTGGGCKQNEDVLEKRKGNIGVLQMSRVWCFDWGGQMSILMLLVVRVEEEEAEIPREVSAL